MGPFDQLLTQSSGPNVAPETLEMLGRQASQMFQSQGVPLNQAIRQVLGNHPELGNEHIKRIVEFANTVTFQEMFQQSQDKNIHFEVADPGVVLRDLKDGGSPAFDGKTLTDYKSPPAQQQNSELDSALASQFLGSTGNTEMGKVASVNHELHANPVEDAWELRTRLVASREKLAESHETIDLMRKQAHEDLYQQIKLQVAHPDGAGLGGVLAVLEKVAEADILEVLIPPMILRLREEGFMQEWLSDSLEKKAGVHVNFEHPMVAAIDAMLKLAGEQITCGHAIYELDQEIEKVEAVFKKTAGSLTTNVKRAINPSGSVPAGIRQRFPRS